MNLSFGLLKSQPPEAFSGNFSHFLSQEIKPENQFKDVPVSTNSFDEMYKFFKYRRLPSMELGGGVGEGREIMRYVFTRPECCGLSFV